MHPRANSPSPSAYADLRRDLLAVHFVRERAGEPCGVGVDSAYECGSGAVAELERAHVQRIVDLKRAEGRHFSTRGILHRQLLGLDLKRVGGRFGQLDLEVHELLSAGRLNLIHTSFPTVTSRAVNRHGPAVNCSPSLAGLDGVSTDATGSPTWSEAAAVAALVSAGVLAVTVGALGITNALASQDSSTKNDSATSSIELRDVSTDRSGSDARSADNSKDGVKADSTSRDSSASSDTGSRDSSSGDASDSSKDDSWDSRGSDSSYESHDSSSDSSSSHDGEDDNSGSHDSGQSDSGSTSGDQHPGGEDGED